MRRTSITISLLLTFGLGFGASCGDDDDNRYPPPSSGAGLANQTGEACAAPVDCYDGVLQSEIQGEVQCLDRVYGGYCTHLCQDDSNCCAVVGECDDGFTQVCGPFESTGMMMCFMSCEDADRGNVEEQAYCAGVHPDFICRSTGGGSQNRKVCVPSGGGPCAVAQDCGAAYPYCCLNALNEYRCYDAGASAGRSCL